MSLPKGTSKRKIVVFASGSGTNAENIIKYFQKSDLAEVVAVFSNNPSAKVLQRAKDLHVKTICFDREDFYTKNQVLHILENINPDLIVLAGFLWFFPSAILKKFPDRVINLHPALLPKFGGKGMFGEKVHRAVLDKKEKETGISIHYVNDKYDEGRMIFQEKIPVNPGETADGLAAKIHNLEYKYFPRVIEDLLENLPNG